MHSFLGFLGTVILFIEMVNYAHADTDREDAERLRIGVVLEAGEIDSSTVEVGALAIVVYGQGERQPTSGAWAKLDTVTGCIKAVDQRRLIIGLEPDGWSRRIALERIQILTLVGSPSPSPSLGPVVQDSTQADMMTEAATIAVFPQRVVANDSTQSQGARFREMDGQSPNRGNRIMGKLFIGTLVGGTVLLGIIDAFETAIFIGYPVGVGLGTSLLDRHDYPRSLVFSLGGSFLGTGVGIALVHRDQHLNYSPLYVPPITATLASELFRKPPESDRFSFGLMPDARGNWSAVATLRF